MDLLFVSNLFPDEAEPWRGLDNVTLLHALRDLDASLRIRVLAFRPSITHFGRAPKRPRVQDVCFHPEYFWTPYLPKLGGLNHWLFARVLAKAWTSLPEDFHPQAILAPWLFPDACAVSLVAAKKSIPVVAVAQGSDAHQYLDMPMRRSAIVAMTKRVKSVVTRSNDLEKRLISHGARLGGVQTIYNGVDVHTFRPVPRHAARRGLELPPDEQLLLFVGNFLPVKGLDLLLQSFALVVARTSNPIKLALIGGGPLESALRSQAEALGISSRLLFLGRQQPSEVARWMQAADAICMTSHNEGVPNVVLESLSCGRVPVCTDVGGIAEIIEPILGRRFLVPSRDAEAYASALMDALQNSPDEMGLHESMQSFSWENCSRQYLDLLTNHLA
ncbi:glycosyltransferase [Prosthecobacter sp.]|uniref:glycosyltransferase n=1 Tax=Prosthecobacter sp. TaxID=1965333 RepID=UPI002488ED5E|nr:glycosyltransferase [Prosthecobacter sp.]MDI1310834.1 glycosyltransferase [Prosthecobacter sp.]